MIVQINNSLSYELPSYPNLNILQHQAEYCLYNNLYTEGYSLKNEYNRILSLKEEDLDGELAYHKFMVKKDNIKVHKYLIVLIYLKQEIVKEETNKKNKHNIVEYEDILIGCIFCKRREIMFYMKEEYRNNRYMSLVYQDFIDNFPEYKYHYNTSINLECKNFLDRNNIKHKIG